MQSQEEIRNILLKTLHNFWGYSAFREGQEEIVFSVLHRKDTLALLPTGGGKSLCYQLPALVMEGVCVVISPLLALMKDQIFALKSIGVEAEYLSAELDDEEQEVIYEKAMRGDIKLLYVSPERVMNATFLRKIQEVNVSFIAVDEAHCISEWGQDFRPSYQHIRTFREMMGNLPCLALTATATPKVVKDIQEKLALNQPNIFQKSYQRKNLNISIEQVSDKYQWVLDFLRFEQKSGIIYTRTRKEAEELTQFLTQKGLENLAFYHAGLSPKERNERQKKWQRSEKNVLISTNAFGMGIDKDNVRFVMHFSPSASLENYYQEIGRAGRDGQESRTILLWNEQELSEIEDIFANQIPNKGEFARLISYLYSIFQVGEGEFPEAIYQLDLSKIQKLMKISYAKIKNVMGFLHHQEVIFWNNTQSLSSIELKIAVEDLDNLAPKDAYFIELLLRNISGVSSRKSYFSEHYLTQKIGLNIQEIKEKIRKLEEKGYLEYIDGNEDSIKFLRHRNSREIEGKYWKLFEKIQQNKLQKWAEMKYFVKNKEFCKMRLILAYFGEKSSENCGKCDVCLENSGQNVNALEGAILGALKQSPMTFDELKIRLYPYEKEQIFEELIGLLNLEKIRMLNYKTYMINE